MDIRGTLLLCFFKDGVVALSFQGASAPSYTTNVDATRGSAGRRTELGVLMELVTAPGAVDLVRPDAEDDERGDSEADAEVCQWAQQFLQQEHRQNVNQHDGEGAEKGQRRAGGHLREHVQLPDASQLPEDEPGDEPGRDESGPCEPEPRHVRSGKQISRGEE